MEAIVAAFNLEKAPVGAFSVIANLRMDLFQALEDSAESAEVGGAVRRHNGINHPDEYSQVFGEWGLGISGGSKEGGGK